MGGPSCGWVLVLFTKPGAWRRSRGSSGCRMTAQPQLTRYLLQLRSLAEFLPWYHRSVAHLREVGRTLSALPLLFPVHSAGILLSRQVWRTLRLAAAARQPFSRRPRAARNAEMALTEPLLPVTSWVSTRTSSYPSS